MEELLQSVTSVRKGYEERRKARPQLENLQNVDIQQIVVSPNSNPPRRPTPKQQISQFFKGITRFVVNP